MMQFLSSPTEESIVINFLDTDAITRVGCFSSCKKSLCHPNYIYAFGSCNQERFRIHKVLNTKNRNVKSGDPVALESLFRNSQWFDCRKGNCTLTTCATDRSTTTAPLNITQRVCIHHRLRMYALTKRDGKLVQTTDMVYFKHLDEDKYLNCLGKSCRLITEGSCGGSTSSSGSSGAALCERQLFSITKISCQ